MPLWLLLLIPACGGGAGGEVGATDEKKVAAAEKKEDGAAQGTERGACYGNGTCNDGLQCLSDLCVKSGDAPPDAPAAEEEPAKPQADPPPTEAAPAEPEVHPTEFDDFYVGAYGFGVNRVNDGKRNATATIHKENGRLEIHASIEKGPHSLQLDGVVQPVHEKEFVVYGSLKGTPDLAFMDKAPTAQESSGEYRFWVKKGRKYWRLMQVDGKDCDCGEDCGNDWCYVDVGPKK